MVPSESMTTPTQLPVSEDYRHGFHDTEENYVFKSDKGLTREIVERISAMKNEPEWMLEFRLKAYETFISKPMPTWGDTELLNAIDFADIRYFVKSTDKTERSWDDVPDDIKRTFDRLGIPEAERKFLSGVSAQYESEVVYHNVSKELDAQGVLFCDMDTAVKQYPEIVRKYLATVIPIADNKFSALNSAVWSGGSFIYVPPGVEVKMPLQAYFRINAENMGQFERTLIIADKGAKIHYIEGCTAPKFSTSSLHSAVVELIADDEASIRYTTIQNWYRNIYNLVTKRAIAQEECHRGMGRWQHRLKADDEVSVDLPHGRRCARRDSFDGVCGRRPASRRRREGHPCRAEHDVGRHQQERERARRQDDLSRVG